jgi:hypothetical protein
MPWFETIISAAMVTMNAKPSAMRTPVRIAGSAAGRMMRRSRVAGGVPMASALQTKIRGTPWTP